MAKVSPISSRPRKTEPEKLKLFLHERTDLACRIESYLHCNQCLHEKPTDISLADWARLTVGMTRKGIQVWCVRHNCNIVYIQPHCPTVFEEMVDAVLTKDTNDAGIRIIHVEEELNRGNR